MGSGGKLYKAYPRLFGSTVHRLQKGTNTEQWKLGTEVCVPDVKRLCGSGAVGQSFEVCGELGNGGSPLGMGFGCRKLSEKSDCDSVTAPSKGDRAL